MPKKTPPLLIVHATLVLVSLIYGVNYIFLKQLIPAFLSPVALLLIRSAGACAFLWILVTILRIKEPIKEKKHFLPLFLCGVFGASMNQLLFFSGIAKTSALNTSLLVIAIPLFVLIISLLSKQEKATWLKVVGLLLGMLGAALIIITSSSAENEGDLIGDLYVLINCVLFAGYLILVKPLMKHYHALTVAKWVFLFGTLVSFPICINQFTAVEWSSFTPKAFLIIAFLVLVVTSAGYILNIWAMKFVDATRVSFYIYLQPFFTAITAYLVFGEYFTLEQVAYSALIFVGVYLVNK
ncbi:MAG: DMT family transporter [Cyclobacteriaceae bacterium]